MKTPMKMIVIAAAAGTLVACNIAQPTPECTTGHGSYAAKFTPVAGSTPTGICNRPGDLVGVQKYRQTDGSINIVIKSEWQSENLFTAIGSDPDMPLAVGELPNRLGDADNFCTIPTFTPATIIGDIGDPLGNEMTYQWSNVKLYVTGAVPGTQFSANLTISSPGNTTTGDPACTANYTVQALYPIVFCFDGTTGELDSSICKANTLDPQENVQDHWYTFLTMNPLFDATCQNVRNPGEPDVLTFYYEGQYTDPGTIVCVPTTDVPSLLAE